MDAKDNAGFRAATGQTQAFGATPEQALSTLMQRLPGDALAPIVIWPYNRGDAFFTDAQQARLQALKARQATLTPEEHAELETLVASAFNATVARTQALPRVKS